MDQSAREKFFERIEAAPLAARGFFESVDEHFRCCHAWEKTNHRPECRKPQGRIHMLRGRTGV